MTLIQRRLIFYFLVVIFLLGAPAVIFYAIGYSYDFQNNRIVQTGGIYLKSTPSGAQIYLNGKKDGATPALLSRLAPKDYQITISQDGFYDWKKTLPVNQQLVTEARNVYLFPKKINPELVDSAATTTIAFYLANQAQRDRMKTAAMTASTTAGWLLDNQTLYFISTDSHVLYSSRPDGANKNQLSAVALPAANYQIFAGGNNFLALTAGGDLYLIKKEENSLAKIAAGVKGAGFSRDNKKILFFNNREIYVYFLEDILVQPYKNAGDIELITRLAQPINQAIFYPNNEYIAYVSGDGIKDIELDDRDSRNQTDLIATPASEIYFNRDNDYFYYKTGADLYRFKIE